MNRHNDVLIAWLRYYEAHPDRWKAGEIEIPLGPVGLTFDEVGELFDRPTLTEVRRAVEQCIRERQVSL